MTLLSELHAMRKQVAELAAALDAAEALVSRHEEQINGQRGLQRALDENTQEIKGLRKAAYWVAGLIISSSVGFAISVLLLIPQ